MGSAWRSMDDRIQKERRFHNQRLRGPAERAADKYYSITRASMDRYLTALSRDARGKRVLEYGCGPGSYAFHLARRGARVTGIDISEVAIRRAKEKAAREVPGDVTFRVMNAEALEFADDSFDVICGKAILHHLDLGRCYSELARTLKPDGRACFIEPMGHNPLINMYRRLTPGLRTEDEHPLVMPDLALARRYFGLVETEFFHLSSILAVPFRGGRVFSYVLGGLETVDRLLFAVVPFAKRLGWTCVMSLGEPLPGRLGL